MARHTVPTTVKLEVNGNSYEIKYPTYAEASRNIRRFNKEAGTNAKIVTTKATNQA